MLGYFDKKKFAELLKQAVGDQSAYSYSQQVGVDRSQISRYLNQKFDKPPTVDTIQRLASKAANGITFEQLMLAAGHLGEGATEFIKKQIKQDIDDGNAKRVYNFAPPELAQEFDKLGFEIACFLHDNEVTIEELEDLLTMLRAVKSKKMKKK